MHPRIVLSVGNFFFSIFSALVTITLLPFLATFMPSAYTGLVVSGSAVIAIVLFPFLPQFVARYGAQQIALILVLAEIVVLVALAAAPGVIIAVLLVAFTIAMQPFLSYGFDLLLEATTVSNGTEGEMHALFRTAWSIAALAAPLLLGALLVTSDSYSRVFIAASGMLVPIAILFVVGRLPQGPVPRLAHLKETFFKVLRNRDLAAVICANLLLYLFYVWMPLYSPVYLHDVLGIGWSSLGWIFSLTLIPYVVIEYPAGWLADHYLGDKELMFFGFLVAGGGLAALSFFTSTTALIVIAAILVASRVGAALVESMVDGHFFRGLEKRDISSVSVYRSVWPLSYLLGPLVGSIILLSSNYGVFFLTTGGIIMVLGTITTLFIKDFK